ncbi:long-chain acyl-CoA synthetase [Nocardiopsis flavescens]|uniref:Long-chain acyl-CoA synthetase n=1 Tax=Nocardiopsis flavescens TaxID=758803 RepID=A0A1M6JP37_9ACTN|nr:AMP-binding protein [Nocardiopsis flavescens]SHJ48398.1 long-chain acyl-CoA synthetase [Nocardiopsis flavescens]
MTSDLPPDPHAPPDTLPGAWRLRVRSSPDAPALAYFDRVLTAREADALSDALACALAERGVGPGDRVGVRLQNIPQFALTLLALWKLGAAALPVNPMYRGGELRRLVEDAAPVGIVCADTDHAAVRGALDATGVRWVLTTCDRDLQGRDDPRVLTAERAAPSPDGDLLALARGHAGRRPPPAAVAPGDTALLTYTSGTTGPPKGAMNTHANVLAVTSTFGRHADLRPGDAVLALAPLFHITGAVINAALALVHDTLLVFAHRFRADVALEAVAEHRVTFTIGSITAFNALYDHPGARPGHLRTVRALYSGGAPVPPSTVERFEERFGVYIHNAYGMTETTSGVIAVPLGERAPVDPVSGSLSVGRPLPGVTVRTVDPSGAPVAPGEQGELEIGGPSVVPGYRDRPGETAAAFPGGRLRTGDVAVVDGRGWVYLVDRLKDQINVSGYKVWPREVEDVLHRHPAVFEAAVVGRPDPYRGESVVAYVSLASGARATGEELAGFAREHLAAYKRPREVHVVDALPKTATGKIRRRALREAPAPATPLPTDTSGGGA